jgi:ankyrin repeat protein
MENIAFVNFYLSINGDINIKDKKGRNALHYLAMNDSVEILNILLENNIDVNQKDYKEQQTPVFFALKYNSFKVFKILLRRNGDVNVTE